ncbi:hypothetical protein KAR91_07065, partial [Candidatus Pacearchaeota archaeon]|nr:hypothetical protein [Candidatus Pacearchaeota archaeon]
VVESEESSIGETVVETKQIAESSKLDVKADANATVKLSEEELFAMNKEEQTALLKKLGADSIPRYEKDRVKLLLELGAK